MPFSQATITSVTDYVSGLDLVVSWTTTSPAGTWFQVYLARQLVWWGTATTVTLPVPTGVNVWVDVGAVDAGEQAIDYSNTGLLPAIPPDRAQLTWYGGTFEAADIAGFHIYACDAPGAAVGFGEGGFGEGGFGGATAQTVDFSTILGTVPAYTAGQVTDGWGLGPFGIGGFGKSASTYTWTSGHLAPGVWTFAVAAFDAAGNEDPDPPTWTCVIAGPPRPPAANAAGLRLTYTYDATTRVATLNWLASPGY